METNPDQTQTGPLITPKRTTLLGDLEITPATKSPLGGLNPYNEHFEIIGQLFFQLLLDHTHLTPSSVILDIGCGTGRLAKQLASFLDSGQYYGFDPNERFLRYCPQRKNFRYCHLNLQHDEYNQKGAVDAGTVVFPYKDKFFDTIISVAVFNHLRANEVMQYIKQVARVLKPRGTFFCTMILLNNISMEFIKTVKRQPYLFPHKTPESWHDYEVRPLLNIAHYEEAVRRVCLKSNLTIREPIRYGEWCRSKVAVAGPDVLIIKKN